MKYFLSLLTLVLAIAGSGSKAVCQSRIELDKSKTCTFNGEDIEDDLFSFSSTQEAIGIRDRIVESVGLKPNFRIQAANVPNASATIINNQRMILYSQSFISRIEEASGTDWAGITILAHEIGHHLNGHTISEAGSRPPIELEADEFSGFVSAKMGATLSQAQGAMERLASRSGSVTHPPRSARLEAIAVGWKKGSEKLSSSSKTNGSNTKNDGDYFSNLSGHYRAKKFKQDAITITVTSEQIVQRYSNEWGTFESIFHNDGTGKYFNVDDEPDEDPVIFLIVSGPGKITAILERSEGNKCGMNIRKLATNLKGRDSPVEEKTIFPGRLLLVMSPSSKGDPTKIRNGSVRIEIH